MSRTSDSLPLPPPLIVAAGLAGAVAVGCAMVLSVRLGLASAVALCYVPLALLNLRMAIVVWLPSVGLIAVTALDVGPNLAGMVILVSWFGAMASHRSGLRALIQENAGVLLPLGGLLVWLMLSMAWAEHPPVGSEVFFGWLVAGVIVLVISTVITDRRYLRLAVAALVLGAVVSVGLGLFGGAIQPPSAGSSDATGRIVGGSGDPNFLAAGVVPAIVLAAGLAAGSTRVAVWVAAGVATALLTVGLVASESRGGFVAALLAAVVMLVLAKRHRAWAVAFLLCVTGIAAAWFSTDPAAWERLSDFNESNGRSELWGVAVQMWQDNPVAGVGLQAFVDNADGYVRELGSLEFAEFLTEQPKVVHNTYLELLAETGLVGLILFVAVIAGTLRAAWRAAALFELIGDRAMATLAKSVIAATAAMLASTAFVSGGIDRRFWVLVAFGPALLATARLQAGGGEQADRFVHPRRRSARRRVRAPIPATARTAVES